MVTTYYERGAKEREEIHAQKLLFSFQVASEAQLISSMTPLGTVLPTSLISFNHLA